MNRKALFLGAFAGGFAFVCFCGVLCAFHPASPPSRLERDIIGCVASVTEHPDDDTRRDTHAKEVESKLIQTAAGFLGKQLES